MELSDVPKVTSKQGVELEGKPRQLAQVRALYHTFVLTLLLKALAVLRGSPPQTPKSAHDSFLAGWHTC